MVEDCYFEQEKKKMDRYLPPDMRRILPYVENECNRLEYAGSWMFDETPDVRMMSGLCDRIYAQVQEKEPSLFWNMQEDADANWTNEQETFDERLFATSRRARPPKREPDVWRWIQSLLNNEFFARRCRNHERCRRY